jgi:hypothetical protein
MFIVIAKIFISEIFLEFTFKGIARFIFTYGLNAMTHAKQFKKNAKMCSATGIFSGDIIVNGPDTDSYTKPYKEYFENMIFVLFAIGVSGPIGYCTGTSSILNMISMFSAMFIMLQMYQDCVNEYTIETFDRYYRIRRHTAYSLGDSMGGYGNFCEISQMMMFVVIMQTTSILARFY